MHSARVGYPHGSCDVAASGRREAAVPAYPSVVSDQAFEVIGDSCQLSPVLLPCVVSRAGPVASDQPSNRHERDRTAPTRPQWPWQQPGLGICRMVAVAWPL